MKRGLIAIIIAVGAMLGTCLPAVQAHAAVLHAVPDAAPYQQLAYNGGDSSLCFNRYQNGKSIGTPVIAYNCGQPNNDFFFYTLSGMCNGGFVTTTCPFTVNSGLNDTYDGDLIVTPEAYGEGECVGGSSAGATIATLQACPNRFGNGGGWSTIDILAYSVQNNDRDYYVMINRNWSNALYNSHSGCTGSQCAYVVGSVGYKDQLLLSTTDVYVRNGELPNAAPWDQWTQITQP
jgi:hypothetical protein